MNSRERVKLALEHKEPDRVPLDLGATYVTGIHVRAYHRWREALGLPKVATRIFEMLQQLAVVDDDMVEILGVDVRPVTPGGSLTFHLEIQDMGDYTCFYDEWGIGWRMPKDRGLYYDMFDHPLAGDITEEAIARLRGPDPLDPGRFVGMREAARRVAEEEQRAVVVTQMTAGVTEIAAWTRGYADFYADLAINHALVGKLMDKVNQVKAAYWGRALEEVGEYVDVMMLGDDFAGQDRLLMSPRTWRKLVKPRLKDLFDFLHARSRAKLFLHSCGAVREVIPDLIEIGLDILNPVQVSAAGMDSAELKREFGKDLVFWGGGVDTQRVLPYGTPEDVRAEVRRRLEDLCPGGGFVFNPVHNIQSDVPTENLQAMWETLQAYGVYAHTLRALR
jgi:uroporphyrinogen decarboxylase